MHEKAAQLYRGMHRFHMDTTARLLELKELLKSAGSLEELAEIGYTFREAEKLIDDVHKQLRSADETAQQALCAVARSVEIRTIKTPYVTATTEIKLQGEVPKKSKNPEAYEAVCRAIGIPEPVIAEGIVDIRWPEYCQYLTDLTRAEQPLPPGIMEPKPLFRVTYRGRCKPSETPSGVNKD